MCIAKPVDLDISTVANTNRQVVSNQCRHPDCILSFLEDYRVFVDQSATALTDPSSDSCRRSTDSSNYFDNTYTKYRSCKALWYGSANECWEDRDCVLTINGTQQQPYQCDILSHVCMIPVSVRDRMFVRCLLDSMDYAQVHTITLLLLYIII